MEIEISSENVDFLRSFLFHRAEKVMELKVRSQSIELGEAFAKLMECFPSLTKLHFESFRFQGSFTPSFKIELPHLKTLKFSRSCSNLMVNLVTPKLEIVELESTTSSMDLLLPFLKSCPNLKHIIFINDDAYFKVLLQVPPHLKSKLIGQFSKSRFSIGVLISKELLIDNR
jgi:hypothetical protein